MNPINFLFTIFFLGSGIAKGSDTFKIKPSCDVYADMTDGYWFLPVSITYKSGEHAGKTETSVYRIRCEKPSCTMIKFPEPGAVLDVFAITDIPEKNLRITTYTSNRIQIILGVHTFDLRRDSLSVSVDMNDDFAEGTAICPKK